VQAVTAYRRALDTFVAEIDGIPYGVTKGAVLSEDHPAVKHDMANGGVNFAVLDTGEAPPKSAAAKAAPEAEAKPAVKDSPPKAPARAGKGPS
jgi:hypothetical protein